MKTIILREYGILPKTDITLALYKLFKENPENTEFVFENDEYYLLFFDLTQRAVKKLCDDLGEGFTISTKALGKALAEEGFIHTDGGENARSKKIGGKSRRVLMLRKDKVRELMGE